MFEKITEAEINERSMANVSTTPNRPTAFGESKMDAQALKLRFDRLGRYLAGRINEIFAGISDGNLAKNVKIVEEKDGKTIEYSLAEFILKMIEGDLTQINVKVPEGTQRLDVICNQVLRWQNEIKTGDFADETVVVQGVTIRQFYEEFKKLEETGQGKPGEPGKSAYDYAVEGGYQGTEEEFAKKLATEYPSKVSQLENDEEYITASGAPVQTVNGKTGDVELSASDVGARPNTWMPSYSDVNADKAGTAQSLVSGHNTSTDSHNDIRLELQRLAGIIADVLDSDDTTLDEMHEIVAVIKANTTIIEAITTSKVNVTDIIDNLATNVKDKPLSAAQGVALKALIDALTTGKLDATELTSAINTALAQAKASGEFDGADGKTPYIQNGYWYIDGVNTNVKAEGKDGDDYVLTDADKNQIAAVVLEMLGGEPIFGYVDENNNIVLSGNLADGTYTVKYELDDGTTIDIGDLVLADEPAAPTITSISASKTTTSYTVGDTLNTNDITVTATYSDGSTKTITDFTVDSSAVQMGTAGTYSLVVSYGGVNTTISIKVAEKAVEETHTNLAGTLSSGRLSASASGYVNSDTPNARVTDYIAIEQGDTITVKGFDKSQPTVFTYMVFTSSKTRRVGPIKVLSETSEYVNISDVTSESYKAKITSTADDVSYIRFGGFPTGSESNIVVNIQHSDGTWE